jgi:group I intron endonuclease
MRLYNKVQVLKLLNQHLGVYPTPMNLNWNWSWGALSGLLLASQIVTGILLAMHYVGHVDHAFASVQHLMVDVPSGIILRYAHANGASLFFTVVYLHILRGLYYSSGNQPREILWISGVVILLLMIITAFIGAHCSQKWFFNFGFFYLFVVEGEITNQLALSTVITFELLNLDTLLEINATLTPSNYIKRYDNLHVIDTQLKIARENKQKAGIYGVLNRLNGNLYVGSASSNRIHVRFRNHCINRTGGNPPLTRSIAKYGLESFSFIIFEYFPGFIHKEDLKKNHLKLLERENHFFKLLRPEYNILQVAGSSLGYKHTDETKQKMKLKYSNERRLMIGSLNKGKSLSEHTKRCISESRKKLLSDFNRKAEYLAKQEHVLFKGKPVQLFDLNGNFVSEYTSILEMSRIFKTCRKTIRKCLHVPNKIFRQRYFVRYKKK